MSACLEIDRCEPLDDVECAFEIVHSEHQDDADVFVCPRCGEITTDTRNMGDRCPCCSWPYSEG